MAENWTALLDKYINKLISPDGRQTYESKDELVNLMLKLAELKKSDKVMDIGCGWGNFSKVCSNFSDEVIGIEPNADNLQEAINRSNGNVKYIQGSFEELNCNQSVNKVISMLAFHQVPWDYKEKSLENISKILTTDGYFYLCDTMLLFDTENDTKLFNKVYRFLLKETTPEEIYKNYIEPYLKENEVYTVEDMRENSHKDNWFYSLKELEHWSEKANMELVKTVAICPFFGVLIFKKNN